MTVPLHVLEAMEAAGCSAAQIVAVIRADRDHEIGELCWQAVASALASHQSSAAELEGESGSVTVLSPVQALASTGWRVSPEGDAQGSAKPIALSGKAGARYGLLHDARLRPAARAVGAVLLDRFNLTTGRCDPGLASLAAATGRTERSVRRAVAELEAAGLFKRVVHGGARHRNAYVPDWVALEADSGVRVEAKRTLVSGEADSGVRQNLKKETRISRTRAKPPRRPDPKQPQFFYPMPGRQAVAQAGAARRVMDAVMVEASRSPGFNVSGLGPADWDEAHAEEARSRGGGIVVVKSKVEARKTG